MEPPRKRQAGGEEGGEKGEGIHAQSPSTEDGSKGSGEQVDKPAGD